MFTSSNFANILFAIATSSSFANSNESILGRFHAENAAVAFAFCASNGGKCIQSKNA
jgi:hypothetical protein